METELSLHENMRTGVIHGLKYYLLPNTRPKDHLELRLLVHVGSLMEDEDEQGIAHFIEHLGFKGTKSYAGYELVKALQSLGITYGADLNASTHLLETVYRLSLQIDDNLSQIQLGLHILKEWAFDMNISPSDVHEERNVISSEYLSKQGLSQRLLKKYWSKLFGGSVETTSLLANRMPIGIPEVFMNISNTKIREFYERWYRPENMAILIVGDIAGKENDIEAMLLKCFSESSPQIGDSSVAAPPPLYSNILQLKSTYLQLPYHQEDIVICMQDQELTVPQMSFEFFSETQNSNSTSFIRDNIKHRLLTSLLDRRYAELIQKEKLTNDSLAALGSQSIPFQSLGMSIRELVRGLTCVGVTASLHCEESVVEGKEQSASLHPAFETAIRLLLLEFRRFRTYGIYSTELADAKQKWAYLFKDQRDHHTTTSSALASDLTTHIFTGGQTVFATPFEEANLSLQLMNEITVTEMNSFLSSALDMDLCEGDSQYYQPSSVRRCSFRTLTAQIPQKPNLEVDSDGALQLALSRARDYVRSIPVVDPWPTADIATEESLISAAHMVIDQLGEKEPKVNEIQRKVLHSEEAKSPLQDDFRYNLCACCKQQYCMFIGYPPTSVNSIPKAPMKSTGIKSSVSLESIGATEFTFRNGVKVCVKQMPAGSESPGRISLQAFALGGCTELSEEEDALFSMLDSMCGNSTLFVGPSENGSPLLPLIGMHFGDDDCGERYSQTANENTFQILDGKKINHIQSVTKTRVNTQRHMNFRGIGGSCPSEKFELLLALLILKLTCQQIDQHSYEKTLHNQKSGLTFRENSPEFMFMERARILSCGDLPYSRPLTADVLENVSIDMARNLYARAFLHDPTEFTFVFVGDLPPMDEVSSLLDHYLGSLVPSSQPSIGEWRRESTLASSLPFTSVATNFSITHRQTETVRLRQDDKASSLIVFRAYTRDYEGERGEWIEEEGDLMNTISLDLACRSLQSALLDSLRIDLGKVYSVSADWCRGSLSPLALISLGLHCHPDDLAQITSEIERCIEAHHRCGPNPVTVKGTIEALITKQKNALKCPSHWLFWILDSYKSYRVHEWKERDSPSCVRSSHWVNHFASLRSYRKIDLMTKAMTIENLTNIYQRYFDLTKSVQVLLCPFESLSLDSSTDQGGAGGEERGGIV
jgi:predicted Zn-dependent peptidase